MLTREDDIDAHALRKRGWKITAIANHLGRDRKTIRGYLNGDRVAGQRARSGPDSFEPFVAYCSARLAASASWLGPATLSSGQAQQVAGQALGVALGGAGNRHEPVIASWLRPEPPARHRETLIDLRRPDPPPTSHASGVSVTLCNMARDHVKHWLRAPAIDLLA
jgi:hypothetical protein